MFSNEDCFFSQTEDVTISAYSELADADNVMYYHFCFENNSTKKIQFVSKDWNITDSLGKIVCDNSIGFNGEIPELEPGESFEFAGEVPLYSKEIVFYGVCKVVVDDISKDIKMPTFCLGSLSKASHILN